MPENLILREALAAGVEAIADADLLGLLTEVEPRVFRARIRQHGLHDLYMRRHDLGLTDAERVRLEAVYQLAVRIGKATYAPGTRIDGPDQVAQLLKPLGFGEQEAVKIILLDNQGRLVRIADLALGAANLAVIQPRDIAQLCFRTGVPQVILVHSHPSGSTEISESDIIATRRLSEGLDLVGIRLVDHVVLGASDHASMRRLGLI